MKNAQGMNVIDSFEDTAHYLWGLFVSKGVFTCLSLFHQLAQSAIFNILHLDEHYFFIFEKLKDFYDIGMVKR
jgi:hypothetical protein